MQFHFVAHGGRWVAAGLAGTALAGLVALAGTAPANASGRPCASEASVTSLGPHTRVSDFSRTHPTGAPLQGHTLFANHFYDVSGGGLSFEYGANRYTVSSSRRRDTTFSLECYGQSKGSPANLPNVGLFQGTVQETVNPSSPGAIMSIEGLYGPVPGTATLPRGFTFTVSRAVQGRYTFVDVLHWFAGVAPSPVGTVRLHASDGRPINIIPYVGPAPGHCVHVHGARLVSRRWGTHGHGLYGPVGTVKYFGQV